MIPQKLPKDPNSNWPDWLDNYKPVEIRIGCHRIVGKLCISDWYPDDEGDEIPIFDVVTDHGITYNFASQDDWRFLDECSVPRWVYWVST
jgi:hypothetical protein